MNFQTILRGIAAIVVGIMAGAALSILTDTIVEQTGLVPPVADQLKNGSPAWFLATAIIYRSLFTVLSGYLGARVAPHHKMRYAIALGVIAFLANLGGTVAMWNVGQHWYPIILTILAFPCAYLGGKLCVQQGIGK